jgi:predicted GH43/DUF377 family glycosyl hydrolase
MEKLTRIARNLLTKYGLELKRTRLPVLRFWDVIAAWSTPASGRTPRAIHLFDQDCRLQAEFLRSCDPALVHLWSFDQAASANPVTAPEAQNSPFWLSLSAEQTPISNFFVRAPWATSADVVFVRGTLEEFSSGHCDLPEILRTAATHGLGLLDVSTLAEPVTANALCNRIVLILARPGPAADASGKPAFARTRIADALAFLTPTIVQRNAFRHIAGRESFGFSAGVFNPGAVNFNNRRFVLARAERHTWPAQETSQIRHFTSCAPVLLELGENHLALSHRVLKVDASFDPARTRLEDFRLFTHNGHLYCNHSIITLPDDAAPRDVPVVLHEQIARVGISEVDPDTAALRFLGFPKPDIPTGPIEKNWATFPNGADLCFIYSMSPYRVFQARNWPAMDFVTRVNKSIDLPILPDRSLVRNSINPVDYTATHLLHIVHRVFPTKQYVFWALLIDRQTLIPSHISDRPLVRAGSSISASIVYLCSAVVEPHCVHLYCGVNDIGSGAWTIERSVLDRTWQPLA